MQNFLRLSLVLVTAASIGEVLLRRLPEKILTNLAAPRAHIVAPAHVAVAVTTRPTSVFAFANGGLTPEQIALAGKVVSFSTENLRARFSN